MSKEYSDLLKDPRWQKLKALAMIRDNFTCQECGATDKTLHVHHKKYTGNPWDAPLDDLVTLCEDCHKGTHTSKKVKPKEKSVYDCVYEILYDIYGYDQYDWIRNKTWGYGVLDTVDHNEDIVVIWVQGRNPEGQNKWFREHHQYMESCFENLGLEWTYEYRIRDDVFYPEVQMFVYKKGLSLTPMYDDMDLSWTDVILLSTYRFRDIKKEGGDILWRDAYDIIWGTYSSKNNDKQDGCKEGRSVSA